MHNLLKWNKLVAVLPKTVARLSSRRWRGTRALLLLPILSAASRLVGFLRESLIASRFGVSHVTDAFFVAQQIPLFFANYLTGALSLPLIAFLSRVERDKCPGLFYSLLGRLMIPAALLCSIIVIFRVPIAHFIGHTAAPETVRLLADFLAMLALIVVLYVPIGIAHSVLHANARHALAVVLVSIPFWGMVVLLGLWSLSRPAFGDTYVLPITFLMGTGLASVLGLRILRREGWVRFQLRYLRNWKAPPVVGSRLFAKEVVATSVENVAFNANQFVTIWFAMQSGYGFATVNAYAMRLVSLVLSGFIVPFGPVLQKKWLENQAGGVRGQKTRLIVLVLTLCVGAALMLYMLRERLVTLVYDRGAFSSESGAKVVALLAPYSAYLLVQGSNQLVARFFFAETVGAYYVKSLVAGYCIANVAKPIFFGIWGLEGVIWGSVFGEGLAMAWLVASLIRKFV